MNNTAQTPISATTITDSSGTTIGTNISTTTVGTIYTVQRRSQGLISTNYTEKNIESAVYSHIQAMRALGRTKINTVEISRALGLSLAAVDNTLQSLKKKGVRVTS
jgi:hypothetical protein